jgi:hypothetical protein
MSRHATGKTFRYNRNNLPSSATDWKKVMAMTEQEILARTLADPDAQPLTEAQLAKMKPAKLRQVPKARKRG